MPPSVLERKSIHDEDKYHQRRDEDHEPKQRGPHDQPRQYAQDLIRARGEEVVRLLKDENTYIYLCGLKGMEACVDQALHDNCDAHGFDWTTLQTELLQQGRYHVELY